MDSVIFKVSKDETNEFSFDKENTIEGLKEKIKEIYNISSYIDIDFKIEKPMRVIGKFNVEPGILPRTFDRYELNKFGINKNKIDLTFHVVDNYTPIKNTKKELNLSKYKTQDKEETTKNNFNIESEDDFPKLG
jgi:hypothetical protein